MAFSNFDQFFQANKFMSMEPILAFNGITTRMYSELARENLKLMNDMFQCGVEQMQTLSQARGIDEVMSVHSKMLAKTTPQVLEHTQHVMDTVMKSASEYSRIFEKGFETAAQNQEKFGKEIKERTERK